MNMNTLPVVLEDPNELFTMIRYKQWLLDLDLFRIGSHLTRLDFSIPSNRQKLDKELKQVLIIDKEIRSLEDRLQELIHSPK
jgi:hypothetical protein